MGDDVTLITAFYDIGREAWPGEFQRGASFYIESFLQYLKYDYRMVCFIDDRYIDQVLAEYSKSPYQRKQFIPINREWLDKHCWAWQHIEIDRAILSSSRYKEMIDYRLRIMYPDGIPPPEQRKNHIYPENKYAEYNIVTHSKIDFMAYCVERGLITTSFTYWSDFGYFYSQHKAGPSTYPAGTLDSNKLDPEKIVFCAVNDMHEKDADPYFTLIYARELFVASTFGGPTEKICEFAELYHQCVEDLYSMGVSDDEQHVFVRCILKRPDWFREERFQEWPKGLVRWAKG